MYIGRDKDGNIFGTSTVKQEWATEELSEDHADVVAFGERKQPERTVEQKLAAIGLTVDELKQAMK